MKPLTPTQARVLEILCEAGTCGCTAEELIARSELDKNTAPPRLTELAQLGLAVATGERRATSAGKTAAVWTLSSLAGKGTTQSIVMHHAGPAIITRRGGRIQLCRSCGVSISPGFAPDSIVYELAGAFTATRPLGVAFYPCRSPRRTALTAPEE